MKDPTYGRLSLPSDTGKIFCRDLTVCDCFVLTQPREQQPSADAGDKMWGLVDVFGVIQCRHLVLWSHLCCHVENNKLPLHLTTQLPFAGRETWEKKEHIAIHTTRHKPNISLMFSFSLSRTDLRIKKDICLLKVGTGAKILHDNSSLVGAQLILMVCICIQHMQIWEQICISKAIIVYDTNRHKKDV